MKTPNPKNSLHHLMVLQYLVRVVSDMENQLSAMRSNLDLQKADAVDIIDFIELRAAYEMAVRMEKEIVQILSWQL